MNDKEFEKLLEGIDYHQGGQGDSPYSQDYVDELFGRKRKERKVKKR